MEHIIPLAAVGDTLFTIVSFVVALGVIVFVHEYGHYIVGRWCGIHAEVFSLGMGPAVKKWTDSRGTVWQIAALPIGGYVRFLGDADAASGQDQAALAKMDSDTRSRTMHGATLWRRAATVAAGPVANFILSIAVFAGMVLWNGFATDRPTIGAIKPLPVQVTGLRPGDVILEVDGVVTPDYETLYNFASEAPPSAQQTYLVERDGTRLEVQGPFAFMPVIAAVQPQSAAADAGLLSGDVIVAADGRSIIAFSELQDAVKAGDGAPIVLSVWRDGETFDATLNPRPVDLPNNEGGFDRRILIGVTGGMFFEPATYTPGFVEAIGAGATQTWAIVTGSLNGLKHVVLGLISTCNLQGPLGIAQTSGDAASQGAASIIWFVAVLSTAIGLLNLFPIPVLDGGHLVFFAWEGVTGRPPSDLAVRILMSAGLALILGMMVFALTNDFLCP